MHGTTGEGERGLGLRIAVLGAGIVGVSTAYFLASDGHQVEVVDRAPVAGTDASAGNAGFIAPNDSYAWASPSAPIQLLRSLLGENTGLRIRLGTDPHMYRWGLRFLRECTPNRAYRNSVTQILLSQYSAALQEQVEATEGIEYSVTRRGALYLYRDAKKLAQAASRTSLFEKHGVRQQVLSIAEIAKLDPVFDSARVFVGGIYGETDASGDCQAFTQALLKVSVEKWGVAFTPQTSVLRLQCSGEKIAAAVTNSGRIEADHFVLALGIGSRRVALSVGESLPIYPVKGYSATFPVISPERAPTLPGVEQTSLIAWSKLGDRVRMSSSAEVAKPNRDWSPEHFRSIRAMADELFRGGIDLDAGSYRACLRPMTPDGPPILGYRKYPNLLFNTGHGHLGWTMGVGTGRISADLVAGKRPAIGGPKGLFRNDWGFPSPRR